MVQHPLLVSQNLPRRHASKVSHYPHPLPCSVFSGSVSTPAPHKDREEHNELCSGRVCAALQPLAGRWVHVLKLCPVILYRLLLSVNRVSPHHCHCFSDDPVYMPLDAHLQEYIKSDYGMLYMGSHLNISRQPWSFGQVCDTINCELIICVSLEANLEMLSRRNRTNQFSSILFVC